MRLINWKPGGVLLILGTLLLPALQQSASAADWFSKFRRKETQSAQPQHHTGAVRAGHTETAPVSPAEAAASQNVVVETGTVDGVECIECQPTLGQKISGIFHAHHCPGGYCQGGYCPGGCYGGACGLHCGGWRRPCIIPLDPGYYDARDTRAYSAQGYGLPVSVPMAPVVKYTYNYGWGVPSSRLTPIGSQYQRWYPQNWYSYQNGVSTYGRPTGLAAYQHPPMVYWPTDTTQMGFYYKHVPSWQPIPVPFSGQRQGMVPQGNVTYAPASSTTGKSLEPTPATEAPPQPVVAPGAGTLVPAPVTTPAPPAPATPAPTGNVDATPVPFGNPLAPPLPPITE